MVVVMMMMTMMMVAMVMMTPMLISRLRVPGMYVNLKIGSPDEPEPVTDIAIAAAQKWLHGFFASVENLGTVPWVRFVWGGSGICGSLIGICVGVGVGFVWEWQLVIVVGSG